MPEGQETPARSEPPITTEGRPKIYPTEDRQRAFNTIPATTSLQDTSIQEKQKLAREVFERGLLPMSILKTYPTVYAGSGTDIEYPLALGCRKIIMVDPIFQNPNATDEVKQRIHGLVGEDAAQEPNGTFSFNFDFGEGDESVTIELVPKYYNPEPPQTFFPDAKPVPESERYSIPEQTGMILGSNSHFEPIQQTDIDRLVPGGIILDNRKYSVGVDLTEEEIDLSHEDFDAFHERVRQKWKEKGLEGIDLNIRDNQRVFLRKKE